MELWIRTQDKEDLIEVHSVEVSIKNKIKIITLINANTIIDLGTYESKERALEVLDEIQAILKLKMLLQFDKETACQGFPDNKEDIKVVLNKLSVYEMPKE